MLRGPIDFDLLRLLDADALHPMLALQFERAWQIQRPVSIEEIVQRLPSADSRQLVIMLAELEFHLQQKRGEQPSAGDYLKRFPQYAQELKEVLPADEAGTSHTIGSTLGIDDSAYGKRLAARQNLSNSGLGRYQVIEQLGKGSWGEVWKGYDPVLKRDVAIKLLRVDRGFGADVEKEFLDEGRRLAQLNHSGIMAIHDVGSVDGNYFLVSEYADGGNLAQRLDNPISVAETIRIVAAVADALHYAHTHTFVHRDVKPQNILLMNDGTVKLADFGMAVSEEEQLDEEASVRGTLAFMPPEQLRGDSHLADARSDIYGLGAVMYRMLAGRPPYLAKSLKQLREVVLNREPRAVRTFNDQVPLALEKICHKCLRLQPGDRYTTALDLARDLRAVLAPTPPPPPPAGLHWRRDFAVAMMGCATIFWWFSTDRTFSPRMRGPIDAVVGVINQWFSKPPASLPESNPPSPDLHIPVQAPITVAADGSGDFRTISEALEQVLPRGTIRITDSAMYQENLTIDSSRLEGITIEAPGGATLTSRSVDSPIIKIHGVNHVSIRNLKLLIAKSEHGVMITEGAEGTRLEGLKISQPKSPDTGAVQIYGANLRQDSAETVITDCVFESLSTGQNVWVHAEPGAIYNLVIRRNHFQSRSSGSLVVVLGTLRNVVIHDNQFEGGHIGLNLSASPASRQSIKIHGNVFLRCEKWMGFVDTQPANVQGHITGNLILSSPMIDIKDSQLADIRKDWVIQDNCWELNPATVTEHSQWALLAQFYPQIQVTPRKDRAGFLEPVGPLPCLKPLAKDEGD
ncbi:protein kinase [Schlesneria sp. T3-172]|uniref:protein kinase domain-containing protein n=1 Tax=Schlesneria sphaerica TaxID=3373610 RepID=UPI0037C5B44E